MYFVLMSLHLHRILLLAKDHEIFTTKPTTRNVLTSSATIILKFEPVGNGWLSFGAKDLCMKVGETLDSQSFHLIFDDILHIISFI